MTKIRMRIRGTFEVEFNYTAGKMWMGIPDAYRLQEWAKDHNFEIVRMELIEEEGE